MDAQLPIAALEDKFENASLITRVELDSFFENTIKEYQSGQLDAWIKRFYEAKVLIDLPRDNYILAKRLAQQDTMMVITMDVIKSTKLKVADFDHDFAIKAATINDGLEAIFGITAKFAISQGDEIQILLPFDERLDRILLYTLSQLSPLQVRYGIAIGMVEPPIRVNSWSMNGPLFWGSRDILEAHKKCGSYCGGIFTGYHRCDGLVEDLVDVANLLLSQVTWKQWQVIAFSLEGIPNDRASAKLGISLPSYYDRIKGAHLGELLKVFGAIVEILNLREVIG